MRSFLTGLLLAGAITATARAQGVAPPTVYGAPVAPHVANLAGLQALSVAKIPTGALMIRDGYTTAGDGGAAQFVYSTSNCVSNDLVNDGGGCVQPTSGSGSWVAQFPATGADIRAWGAIPGFDATTALNAAIAWGFITHIPVIVVYNQTSRYGISSTIQIGNGTSTTYSTLEGLTFDVSVPVTEPGSITPIFNWLGTSGGGPMFQVNGPIGNLNMRGIGVNCLNLCTTGFIFNNNLDSDIEYLGVVNQVGGPAFIVTTVVDNTLGSGNEGNYYAHWWATQPGTGGSGMQIGASAGTPTQSAVISDTFTDMNMELDCNTPGTYGFNFGFATDLTFYGNREVCSNGTSGNGNSVIISPPTGGLGFPNDIKFDHPVFDRPVLDPNPSAGWTATRGIEFTHYSTIYPAASVPSSSVVGQFWGTTSNGVYFGAPVVNSWTPTVIGSINPGSPTYSYQAGSYSKIGNEVTIRFSLFMTGLGSPTGNLVINNLPFTSANIANDNGACAFSYWSGITLDAGYTQLGGYIPPNGAKVNIFESGSALAFGAVPVTNVGVPIFSGSCTYRTQ